MKRFRFYRGSRTARGGFNLVEAAFSLGIMSVGFLTLAPLMGFGLKTSRWARDDRISAQIARTLAEEEKQGTLGSAATYLDEQGQPCRPQDAAFVAQAVTQEVGNSASELTLRVTPVGAPGHARVYAVVLPGGANK